MYIDDTMCCALNMMSVSNVDSVAEIKKFLDDNYESHLNDEDDEGPTTLMIVATPEEKKLKKNLLAVGFEPVTTIRRRSVCGQGDLELFVYRYPAPIIEEDNDDDYEDDE